MVIIKNINKTISIIWRSFAAPNNQTNISTMKVIPSKALPVLIFVALLGTVFSVWTSDDPVHSKLFMGSSLFLALLLMRSYKDTERQSSAK